MFYLRFSSTANTTVASLSPQPMPTRARTRHASARQTLASGIKSSSLLIRRCCLRSSLRPTTSISSRCCEYTPTDKYAAYTYVTHSDVGCKTVANMIKGKTPEEIRKLFNIVNDFTPEEEVSRWLVLIDLVSDMHSPHCRPKSKRRT